ncbi:MAG: 30S ribosomal protein S7 [Bacteroidales bacterium]|nr:30S ribosomal protein S7 [Bacteroidales bacterium]
MRKYKTNNQTRLSDPRFNDALVSRFVNDMMYDGKKSLAYKVFYDTLDIVGERLSKEELSPLEIWRKALENVAPLVEVKSRRIGGATFQVPQEVNHERKTSISIKNMIKYARQRSGRSMEEKLAAEIVAAYNGEGGAFKRKEETHRMAEANKAFAHFRF